MLADGVPTSVLVLVVGASAFLSIAMFALFVPLIRWFSTTRWWRAWIGLDR